MSKQAKGFSLEDVNEKGAAFDVVEEPKSKTDDDAIFLEIISDEMSTGTTATGVAPTGQNKNLGGKRKADLYKAYRKLHKTFAFKRGVPDREKTIFYELLATMIEAGVPLIQAVRVFTDQTQHKYFRKVNQALAYQLEKGQSLSQAMHEYPHVFDEGEVGMIESAEATGRLNEVMRRLNAEITSNMTIKSKIRSAMIYPIVVFSFVILAIWGMLKYVIPQITDLFTSTGLKLPALTQFLISASDFVINNGILVTGGTFVMIFGGIAIAKTPPGKLALHTLMLKFPVIGMFQKAIYQAKFSRSISNLMNAGISVVNATEITARSIKNVVYKNKIRLLGKDVEKGIPIAESLKDSPYFSNLLVSMIAIGEKTAQIDELTKKTADYYESKVTYMADNFAKLIQPFIILLVGGMVGVVVLAIMLPMTELLGGFESL